MSAKGEKVGEKAREASIKRAAEQNVVNGTSCVEEEQKINEEVIDVNIIDLDKKNEKDDLDRCV